MPHESSLGKPDDVPMSLSPDPVAVALSAFGSVLAGRVGGHLADELVSWLTAMHDRVLYLEAARHHDREEVAALRDEITAIRVALMAKGVAA